MNLINICIISSSKIQQIKAFLISFDNICSSFVQWLLGFLYANYHGVTYAMYLVAILVIWQKWLWPFMKKIIMTSTTTRPNFENMIEEKTTQTVNIPGLIAVTLVIILVAYIVMN